MPNQLAVTYFHAYQMLTFILALFWAAKLFRGNLTTLVTWWWALSPALQLFVYIFMCVCVYLCKVNTFVQSMGLIFLGFIWLWLAVFCFLVCFLLCLCLCHRSSTTRPQYYNPYWILRHCTGHVKKETRWCNWLTS